MQGKVVLVTGASRGVGLETARGLARAGARVVMAVRSVERGERAREDVLRSEPGARVEVARLDVSDLDDVRRFARAFRASHDRLDVLVNNAGIHTARRVLTPQGFEATFATNHLGHFLLTRELLDLLRRSAPSRVVNVASEAHRFAGGLRLDDLMTEREGGPEGGTVWGLHAYARSKLANILFTRELARRLEGTGVSAFAVHPGSVRTGWARGEASGVFRFGVALASPFLLSPEKGARTSLHAATEPGLERLSGSYFVRGRVAGGSAASRDPEAARRLWEESERLVAKAGEG